jgi:hypothetical protein
VNLSFEIVWDLANPFKKGLTKTSKSEKYDIYKELK